MKKLILIHHEPSLRESLNHLLRGEGYVVHAVDSGPAVVDFCRAEEPHLVIMGLSARWVSGETVDLVSALRREFPSLPIVTLSGDGATTTEDYAKSLGANHHFRTPVPFAEILKIVRDAIH